MLLPAVTHAGKVFVGHVDLRQLDSAAITLRQKSKDKDRVDRRGREIHRTPRLHDKSLRFDVQDRSPDGSVESTKGVAGRCPNRPSQSTDQVARPFDPVVSRVHSTRYLANAFRPTEVRRYSVNILRFTICLFSST